MLQLFPTLVLLGALVVGAFGGGVAGAQGSSGWQSTRSVGIKLSGNSPLLINDAGTVSPLSSGRMLRISVSLKLRNERGLDTFLQQVTQPNSPKYGDYLSREEFVRRFAPTNSQVTAVRNYLLRNGFTDLSVSPNNLLVTGTASVGNVQRAFNTRLIQFLHHGRLVHSNVGPAQVPASLGSSVLSVLGLSNVGQMHPLGATHTTTKPGFTAKQLQKAYNASSFTTGMNTNIAIFAQGKLTQTVRDLRNMEQNNRLPQVPVSIVDVNGGTRSSDTSNLIEWNLDTQYSSGMAQSVKRMYLYDVPTLSNRDITAGFNKFVSQNYARAGSASFGECERYAYQDGSMSTDDSIFKEAIAQGQIVFASSGDEGSSCTLDFGIKVRETSYPASSPYVVAVGGTTLRVSSSGNYLSESAWSGSGGGQSKFEPRPTWESGVVKDSSYRDVPDVAMDAAPSSGARVYYNGRVTIVGGTSLSSPLMLGVWARLKTRHGKVLGFAAPALYNAYRTSGYHDVTTGSNGDYSAGNGWDYPTGMGSINVARMDIYITR